MTTSAQPPLKDNPSESFEARLEQLEREGSFNDLTAEEKAQKIAEEKLKFEESKKKLKDSLYGSLKNEEVKPLPPTTEKQKIINQEEKERQTEIAEAEALLNEDSKVDSLADQSDQDDQKKEQQLSKEKEQEIKQEEKYFENPENMKKFMELFSEKHREMVEKKEFNFPTLDIDEKGENTEQIAKITKIVDHSDKSEQKPENIYHRLNDKKTSPLKIGLVVEIGSLKGHFQNLNNLTMEIPMTSLVNGSFIEHLKSFTNTVLFAMACYEKQKQLVPPVSQNQEAQKKPQAEKLPPNKMAQSAGVESVNQGGNVFNHNGALDISDTSNVSFQCNNGYIWGNMNTKKASGNSNELPEMLDKISKEK